MQVFRWNQAFIGRQGTLQLGQIGWLVGRIKRQGRRRGKGDIAGRLEGKARSSSTPHTPQHAHVYCRVVHAGHSVSSSMFAVRKDARQGCRERVTADEVCMTVCAS